MSNLLMNQIPLIKKSYTYRLWIDEFLILLNLMLAILSSVYSVLFCFCINSFKKL